MIKRPTFWISCGLILTLLVAYCYEGYKNATGTFRKTINTRTCLSILAGEALYYKQLRGKFPEDGVALKQTCEDRCAKCYDKNGQAVDAWGRPLRFQVDPDGKRITIYSVGMNGIDEGGWHGQDTNGVWRDDLTIAITADGRLEQYVRYLKQGGTNDAVSKH